jgi:hypothetical protein
VLPLLVFGYQQDCMDSRPVVTWLDSIHGFDFENDSVDKWRVAVDTDRTGLQLPLPVD